MRFIAISNEIRSLIARRGHSIRSFSQENDLSISYISYLLNNHGHASAKYAKRLAAALEVDVEQIFIIEVKKEAN